MQVKITKSSSAGYWYKKHVGEIRDVTDFSPSDYHDAKGDGYILKSDCEVVYPTTKIVEHDGVKYEVPGWGVALTRDTSVRPAANAHNTTVFVWESAPTWSDSYGYANPKGRRAEAKVYVKPLPVGNFNIAI